VKSLLRCDKTLPSLRFRTEAWAMPKQTGKGKRLIREAPEALRDKARERLERLPQPAQKALHVAGAAAQVMLLPVRLGVRLAQEVLRVPLAMLRVLREG
jgi:hypothetical protein